MAPSKLEVRTCLSDRPFGKLDSVGGKWRVITMQSQRTFIAAISCKNAPIKDFLGDYESPQRVDDNF